VIVIYNISGLLIGVLGIFVGFLAAGVTGSLAVGLLVMSACWAGVGLWWRNNRTPDGLKRRYPAIFFIPLPFLAIASTLLAIAVIPIEMNAPSQSRTPDPRRTQITQAESNLRTTSASGDVTLATSVHNAVSKAAFAGMIADRTNVHATTSDTGVLVLVKISNLKKFDKPARTALLQTVTDTVKAAPGLDSKPLYIGIKGTLMYGAIQTPTQTNLNTDGPDDLLAFFGAPPVEAPVTATPGNP
jgi:hypothetical protein